MIEKTPHSSKSERRGRFLSLVTGGAGKAAVAGNVKISSKSERPSNLDSIKSALPAESKLTQGVERIVHMGTYPIAETDMRDGRKGRLLGIVFAGNSAVGVTSIGQPGKYPDEIKFSVLPFGDNQQIEHPKNTATVATSVDLRTLNDVLPQGYVQRWRDVSIGRNGNNDVILGDMSVSSKHVGAEVMSEHMEFTDRNSTNGTHLLELDDLSRQSQATISSDVLAMVDTLRNEPWTWSPDYDGVAVIPQ